MSISTNAVHFCAEGSFLPQFRHVGKNWTVHEQLITKKRRWLECLHAWTSPTSKRMGIRARRMVPLQLITKKRRKKFVVGNTYMFRLPRRMEILARAMISISEKRQRNALKVFVC
ncbi:hypothetical protein CDAR_429281 [Caerostris darwini]|uniref:Uncharacterized protein n=1 Tax=Caerostris darwini TaxID=1538125 RepID=A0AAV4RNM6_9ARAC|nr:hypothetical protein CDAR_429281 [Caerostris darwini]